MIRSRSCHLSDEFTAVPAAQGSRGKWRGVGGRSDNNAGMAWPGLAWAVAC
jgi:hypothetical protein